MRVQGVLDVLRHHIGAGEGNRTPNLLIRRSVRLVQLVLGNPFPQARVRQMSASNSHIQYRPGGL